MWINYYDYTAYFKTFGENQKFEAIIGLTTEMVTSLLPRQNSLCTKSPSSSGLTFEISYFLKFPLYFSEFPLYN